MTVAAFLSAHKASEIPLKKGVVYEARSTQNLHDAFSILIDNQILSVPVFDEEADNYIGFLDIRDLVSFAVLAVSDKASANSHQLKEIVDIALTKPGHTTDSISVKYLSKRNPFKPVKLDSSLKEVVEILRTVRRVPVLDENNKLVNIISQSSIIDFYIQNLESLPVFDQLTVEASNVGSHPVLSVKESQTALEAFKLIEKTGRNGIAVVDEDGVLTANTSGSDIKLFFRHHETLNQPIMDFLTKIRRLDIKTRAPTFTCKKNDSIATVFRKLNATKSHRIFLVDDHHKALKVISIVDLLRASLTL